MIPPHDCSVWKYHYAQNMIIKNAANIKIAC